MLACFNTAQEQLDEITKPCFEELMKSYDF